MPSRLTSVQRITFSVHWKDASDQDTPIPPRAPNRALVTLVRHPLSAQHCPQLHYRKTRTASELAMAIFESYYFGECSARPFCQSLLKLRH